MIISAASTKRARLSSIGTLKPSNSQRPAPRPMPKITRPPDITSSMAICSATRNGSRQGRTTTIVPSLAVVVRPAA